MMLELTLLRHAPAEERDPHRWPDDALRPLTRSGREVARRAGLGLKRVGLSPTRILTSPALRCAETARIVARALGLPPRKAVEEWPEISFQAPPEALVNRLRVHGPRSGRLLVVGHEPGLGQVVGYLLLGESVSPVRLKRGGAARLEVPRRPGPSAGRLEWVLTRRQLVALAP
jgi:phosphohistidine phosphatase